MAYIGNKPVVGRYASLDTLTFNGSNTNYTLTIGGQPTFPGSPQNLIISVAGVVQSPGDSYTLNGSTIQFTSAPSSGAGFWGVQLGDVYSVALASNTGVASLRTSFTASNNQTTFTVSGGYVPGQIDVYRNGVKLVNGSDVNVSSGNTFVLASAAANNDVIEVIGAQSVTVGGSSTLIKQTFTANSTVNSSFAVTGGYTAGMIDVYVNGVKQVNGTDVNVSSGSNVVFTSALANGSIVDVTGYQALSVYNGYVFRNGDTMTGTLTVPKLYANNGVTDTAGYISTQPTMRNKIINGDMRIDQRNAGASVTPTVDGTYTLDRWKTRIGGAGRFSTIQSSISAANFSTSGLLTVTTTSAPSGTEFYGLQQDIEGYNIADLGWGTANAQSVTISFQVRSSLTGTYCVSLRNSGASKSYVAEFTINSVNTFETKTITVPGDTSGTWLSTNGSGIILVVCLGSGSGREGTAGSWQSSNIVATSNQVDWINTSGATFYITGVQLEKGSVATPFEYRNYQQELAMCMRYYEQTESLASFIGAPSVIGVSANLTTGLRWNVKKRSTPTVTIYNRAGTSGKLSIISSGSSAGSGTVSANNPDTMGCQTLTDSGSGLTSGVAYEANYTASAEL